MKSKFTLIEGIVLLAIVLLIAGVICCAIKISKDLNSAGDEINKKGLKGVAESIWYGSEGKPNEKEIQHPAK